MSTKSKMGEMRGLLAEMGGLNAQGVTAEAKCIRHEAPARLEAGFIESGIKDGREYSHSDVSQYVDCDMGCS